MLLVVLFFVGGDVKDKDEPAIEPDARQGGFPTPPMPAGGAVRGAAAP